MRLPSILPVPLLALVLLALLPGLASAQAGERRSATPFAAEWAGAAVGSAALSGAYLATIESGECGDDFGCVVDAVALLAVVSSAGSVLGLWAATEAAPTDGSMWGGVAGALIGSVAGLFVADRIGGDSDAGVAVSLGLTQGLFTALGSRIGAAVR